MLTFSFTVGSADEARTAAEVCDFLAEQMTNPAKRRRSSKAPEVSNDKPADPVASGIPEVSDPAALYAALSGATPVVGNGEVGKVPELAAPYTPPPAAAETRDDRLAKVRELVKQKGGKWFGDYIKAAGIDKKLSEYTDDELSAIQTAASAA